jgi:hypothetical protein
MELTLICSANRSLVKLTVEALSAVFDALARVLMPRAGSCGKLIVRPSIVHQHIHFAPTLSYLLSRRCKGLLMSGHLVANTFIGSSDQNDFMGCHESNSCCCDIFQRAGWGGILVS